MALYDRTPCICSDLALAFLFLFNRYPSSSAFYMRKICFSRKILKLFLFLLYSWKVVYSNSEYYVFVYKHFIIEKFLPRLFENIWKLSLYCHFPILLLLDGITKFLDATIYTYCEKNNASMLPVRMLIVIDLKLGTLINHFITPTIQIIRDEWCCVVS